MIDAKLMHKFVVKALQILEGEWVVIGGTVLLILGIDGRVTTDIDVVSVRSKNHEQQTLRLMKLPARITRWPLIKLGPTSKITIMSNI